MATSRLQKMFKNFHNQIAMKKLKKVKSSLLENFGVHLLTAVVILAVTTTVSFAWNTNTRLTKLETALIQLASDVHDIKTLLQKGR